jgi:hypothetical protein
MGCWLVALRHYFAEATGTFLSRLWTTIKRTPSSVAWLLPLQIRWRGLPSARAPALEVRSAVYGQQGRDNPGSGATITDHVRSLARDGHLDFVADNGTLGGDPYEGSPKSLWIEYRVGNGPVQSRTIDEGDSVDLP